MTVIVRYADSHRDTHADKDDYATETRKIVRFTIEAFTVFARGRRDDNEIPNGKLYNREGGEKHTNNGINSLLSKKN